MKKKLFAVLMAAAMVCGYSTTAFALADVTTEAEEETTKAAINYDELPQIKWEDSAKEIEGIEGWEGDFVEFDEIGVKLYIPSKFTAIELSDEDIENGYRAYYTLGDDIGIGILYEDLDGVDLTEYASIIEEYFEVTDIEGAMVNGSYMITYTSPAIEDTVVVSFATKSGYIMEVEFTPISNEDFASVAAIIMTSVQEYDIPEVEKEAAEEMAEEAAEEFAEDGEEE